MHCPILRAVGPARHRMTPFASKSIAPLARVPPFRHAMERIPLRSVVWRHTRCAATSAAPGGATRAHSDDPSLTEQQKKVAVAAVATGTDVAIQQHCIDDKSEAMPFDEAGLHVQYGTEQDGVVARILARGKSAITTGKRSTDGTRLILQHPSGDKDFVEVPPHLVRMPPSTAYLATVSLCSIILASASWMSFASCIVMGVGSFMISLVADE